MVNNHVCAKCRKTFDIEDKPRCPFCGFRIVAKIRPPFRKRILAR
ncbi:MAG: DNA-directed RNA polymerase subunit P [Candidatus Aenigmarchaeota archaeon]|nr:DNA-directed RNA polymerase subunit P [Candidatus Aenigmarchaeota archaeon]